EEEELKELAYFLSISKRAEKKKIALDFFRSYFSKLRQTDEREKRQGFVQAEDKKLTSEEFMRKYGSILKL
ncbi:MAG: hypothetical protein NZ927_09915, partial [Candidatus Calescibacterium sp.]|nr:hypothetical protein [Candidatus Calescibacterium sp.]